MSRFTNRLKNVHVASPCPASWDGMIGNDRVRFCGQCELNVYNLSSMSRDEAEALITRTEGRLCVRFYRRNDGSIITEDCPVGLQALKQRMSRIRRAVVSAVLGCLAGIGLHAALDQPNESSIGSRHTMGVMVAHQDPNPVMSPREPNRPLIGELVKIQKPKRR
jgi:hypothetical protein